MALVDVLIGVVIGFVGGVVVPAAVLYRYRHRIGQRLVERQARQTFEDGFGAEGIFDDTGAGESTPGHPETGEMAADPPKTGGTAVDPPVTEEGMSDAVDMLEEVLEGTDVVGEASGDAAAGNVSNTAGTVVSSEDDTGRCDCGELVSPQIDEECPRCGAPVLIE